MTKIYTIWLPDVPISEAYAKTDKIKRSILESMKKHPSLSKNDILPVITTPNILRVIVFNENFKIRADIINSSKESDGVALMFNDMEMYYGMKYYYSEIECLDIFKSESAKGYLQFNGFDSYDGLYFVNIRKGGNYKFKFSVVPNK